MSASQNIYESQLNTATKSNQPHQL